MKEGKIVKQGPPTEVITPELVETVFNVNCRVITDPISGTPLIIPNSRHHAKQQVAG
jgi:iron complex transport system ATP-binding protein